MTYVNETHSKQQKEEKKMEKNSKDVIVPIRITHIIVNCKVFKCVISCFCN